MQAWDENLERARGLARSAAAQLDKKEALQRRGKGFSNVASACRRELAKLSRAISELEEQLVKLERRRTDKEAIRERRETLAALSSDQRALTARSQSGGTGITSSQHARDSEKLSSTRGLLQQQNQMLAEQDAALDDLSTGLSRLKNLGEAIGEEATLQTRLLEDLDADVERGHSAIAAQTDYANTVRKKASTCRLWIIIIILLIILIMLLVMKAS